MAEHGSGFEAVPPVAWNRDRETRGRGTVTASPRCPERGCPWPARRCPEHDEPPPRRARPWPGADLLERAKADGLLDAPMQPERAVPVTRTRQSPPRHDRIAGDLRRAIAGLSAAGVSQREIARQLGLTRGTVQGVLRVEAARAEAAKAEAEATAPVPVTVTFALVSWAVISQLDG
jgi:lambda repressor-like predicted transcriptional regulator